MQKLTTFRKQTNAQSASELWPLWNQAPVLIHFYLPFLEKLMLSWSI